METIATPERHIETEHDDAAAVVAAASSWQQHAWRPSNRRATPLVLSIGPSRTTVTTETSTDVRTDPSITPVDQLQDQGIVSKEDVANALTTTDDIAVPVVPPSESVRETVVHFHFSNRFTMFLSALGAAVGAGSVWRFPRVLALNGTPRGAGGFLFSWVFFLMLYSVPISIAEYALGKKTRVGLVKSYERILGRWSMFIAYFTIVVNMFITFYYSVLTGWTFYYLFRSIFFQLPTDLPTAMNTFSFFDNSIYIPILCHFAAVLIAALACFRGIKTIELVNSCLVPVLLLILVLCFVRALTLGTAAWRGLAYMFTPDFSVLAKPSTWLESLKQNAFDTGAGFGLFLTYANSIKPNQPIAAQATLTPVVNNVISLLCGATMFAVCFALIGTASTDAQVLSVMQQSGPAGTGLTFLWMPVLFSRMPGGQVLSRIFCSLFFLGLGFAALSSLIALMNLPLKALADAGMKQHYAVALVALICAVGGLPSAISLQVLANQDYVWSGGLMFCCIGIALLVWGYGPRRFVPECVKQDASRLYRSVYTILMCGLVPTIGIVLLISWFIQSVLQESSQWYNVFGSDSLMSCLVQWGIALVAVVTATAVHIIISNRRAAIAQTKNKMEQFTLYGVSDQSAVTPVQSTGATAHELRSAPATPTPTRKVIRDQLKHEREIELMDATSPV